MGYACPVCGAEQADGVHLANHLAVTASLGRTDHEEWLAEHAPDWRDDAPEELADRVVEYAPEIETPEFETADGDLPAVGLEDELAARSRRPGRGDPTAGSVGPGQEPHRSDDVESILAEAREMTEQILDDEDTDATTDENA